MWWCRKPIAAADDVGNDRDDQQLGDAAKREAVDAGTCPLLDSAVRALDFADKIVGGDDVEVDGEDVGTDAFKLRIGVDVADEETTGGVEPEDCLEFRKDGRVLLAVGDCSNGAELKSARDRVKKVVILNKKNRYRGPRCGSES